MISHVHRCIFIHVPKCAGTSIEAYLREHAAALGHLPEPGLDLTLRREGLAHALNRHPDYFTFTFVRHPFDRIVSAWRHSLHRSGPYHDRPIRDLSFAEYVRIAAEGRVAQQSRFDRYHLLPQVAFVPSPSRPVLFGVTLGAGVTCGFIGRFERLEDDFRAVCRRSGIADRGLARLNAAAETNASRVHWTAYYDAETIRLVEELYREDLDTFGYEPPSRGVDRGRERRST